MTFVYISILHISSFQASLMAKVEESPEHKVYQAATELETNLDRLQRKVS